MHNIVSGFVLQGCLFRRRIPGSRIEAEGREFRSLKVSQRIIVVIVVVRIVLVIVVVLVVVLLLLFVLLVVLVLGVGADWCGLSPPWGSKSGGRRGAGQNGLGADWCGLSPPSCSKV